MVKQMRTMGRLVQYESLHPVGWDGTCRGGRWWIGSVVGPRMGMPTARFHQLIQRLVRYERIVARINEQLREWIVLRLQERPILFLTVRQMLVQFRSKVWVLPVEFVSLFFRAMRQSLVDLGQVQGRTRIKDPGHHVKLAQNRRRGSSVASR